MAVRTVSNTGGNWNATATWVGGVVPIAGDTVDFTATSGALVVNVATATLAGIDFTNYANTITFTAAINSNGTINLGTGSFTQAGASGLIVSGTATISGTTVWSRQLNFLTSTITLSSDLIVTGVITAGTSNSTVFTIVINNNNLYANGGFNFIAAGGSNISGTTTLRFEGSGSWRCTQSVNAVGAFKNNAIINPTGNFYIGIYYITGTITYSNSNGGTVTSASVVIGNSVANPGGSRSTTFDTNNMLWDQIYVQNYSNTNNSSETTITILSNLRCKNWVFTNIGSGINNNINFSLSTFNLIDIYDTFLLDARVTVNLVKNIEVGNLYFQTLTNSLNNVRVSVKNLIYMSTNQAGTQTTSGTATIIMQNNCSFRRGDNLFTVFAYNLEIEGNATFGDNSFPIMTYSGNNIKYTGNKYSTAIGYLQLSANATLLNFNKIYFQNIIIGGGLSLTMNEFFSGSPSLITNISSVSSNYTITFQDNFEKISKFVNINNCTLSNPQQLLVITNSPKSSTNTRGIRYINQSPNGIAKGDATILNTMTASAGGYVKDPNMK